MKERKDSPAAMACLLTDRVLHRACWLKPIPMNSAVCPWMGDRP